MMLERRFGGGSETQRPADLRGGTLSEVPKAGLGERAALVLDYGASQKLSKNSPTSTPD